jgi:hypothetical protein
VQVSPATRHEFLYWATNVESFKGRCLRKVNPDWVIDCVCKSDASAFGWGGFIQIPDEDELAEANTFMRNVQRQKGITLSFTEIRSLSRKGIEVYGAFTQEQCLRSSTWRELYSVLRILQICAPLLKGVSFYLYLNNVSAVLGLGGKAPHVEEDTKFRGGSRKEDIQDLVIEILDLASLHDMQVRAFWIARRFNEEADALSREAKHSHYGYSILPSIFKMLDRVWGTHTIDRFAETYNCLVQSGRFNSQFYHLSAEWVNALTTHWKGEINWVHPPYGNLAPVIQHLVYCKADCTLIIPQWKGAHWWHLLFPRKGKREDFIKEIIYLGDAAVALSYLGTEKCDIPRADQILALKIRF